MDALTFLVSELIGTESQARQGCSSNPLEVFSFLAFGLYLVNLAMGMGRRKRSIDHSDECESQPQQTEAIMAVVLSIRTYLKILDCEGWCHDILCSYIM